MNEGYDPETGRPIPDETERSTPFKLIALGFIWAALLAWIASGLTSYNLGDVPKAVLLGSSFIGVSIIAGALIIKSE